MKGAGIGSPVHAQNIARVNLHSLKPGSMVELGKLGDAMQFP